MAKCKVCGKRFKLQADKRYDVLKQSNPFCVPTFYECFDCPQCGCQNIVNIRERTIIEVDGKGKVTIE